jgi:glycine/D-amino acid oxidase-like deaminating enzyme
MTALYSPALSRRTLIGGAAALSLSACAPRRAHSLATTPSLPEPCRPLPPVIVERSRIIRQAVGFRPYRPSGFVVREEKLPALGARRLVHNYGHGGGGITLSWGSSRLATDIGLAGHKGPVAVIGAGALGLTTARLVQEAGFPVTLYTAALPPETTSNIAGGEWHPAFAYDPDKIDDAFRAQIKAACRYSYERFQTMIGADYGVRWMHNHEMSNEEIKPEHIDTLIPDMLARNRMLRRGEHPFPFRNVRSWDCPIVETPIFLRAMTRDLLIDGARFVIRKFESVKQVGELDERLIFNCTGLGARELFGDDEMEGWRGQLVMLLPQPEVTYAIHAPEITYMFSRSDAVILGGSADGTDSRTEIDPKTTDAILDRHRAIFDNFRCT